MDGDSGPVVTPLPVGVDDGAPGPELFGLLSEVDRAACNGYQLVQVMAARSRLVSWLQAQLLVDAAELAHAGGRGPDAPPTRMAATDPHTAERSPVRWAGRSTPPRNCWAPEPI
jgi:hypothetical protein